MKATIDKVRADFRNFLFLIWKHLGLPPPTPVQYEIAEFLQYGPRRLMVEAFRGVGKSWITSAFVLWLLLRDPQLKILVVSASKDRSDAFTTFVKRLISEVPLLRHLAPGEGQRSSVVSFDVGPAEPAHAPSVKSVGITGQLAGSRADIIIADDIEVPNNSLTQVMRDRLSEAIKEFDAILSTKRNVNRIIYLGTPQTEMSVYNSLTERGFKVRVWPARFPDDTRRIRMAHVLSPTIIEKLEESPDLVGKSTDPLRFTDIDLIEREASYGRSGFALQFMLDTTVSDADRYPLKLSDMMVHSLDPEHGPVEMVWASAPDQRTNLDSVGLTGDHWFYPMSVSKEHEPYSGCVMFIDPSGRGQDETAYAVVKHLRGRLYLVASGGFRDGYSSATLETLAKVAMTHKVKEIVIEPNYGGGMFNEVFKPVLNRTYKASVSEAEWSKGQKELRIIDTLEPVLNQHRLVVDPKVIETDLKSEREYQLFYQLTRMTKERGAVAHDDRVEALAGAVNYWLMSMAADTNKALVKHKEEALDKALKEFKKHVIGSHQSYKGRPKASHMRI